MVGPFRIDRLIGRGGAGEVYLAHRTGAGFEQQVAIKLLRPEAADRMALFDAERRMLATLEHPGIARLIDGGLAPDGRAFMAMDYVDGVDIVRWCAEHKAELDTRLALFEQVCEAVAYAHRRLVVHRDIKPSNIMIDSQGRPRLLDFGVARLLEAASDEQAGAVPILTPEYAAPEQLENLPTTTAADVYGLGAVLFELLSGRGAWRFEDAPMPVILRRLLHDDPPVPSKVAAERPDAPVTPRALAGDLDAIVLKAMRGNPTERYESVAALADDLKRYRTSLPVRAREGTGLYLTQRFVRRHRWGVAATTAGALAVLVGAGGVAWQARQAAVERDIARAQAARAEAVNTSVRLMFSNASESGVGGAITAKDLLTTSSARLLKHIDPADLDQAAVVQSLAELNILIDDPVASETLLEQALAKGVGRNDPVATAHMRLTLAGPKTAIGKFDEARRLLAQADAVWRTDPARYRKEQQEAVGTEAYIRRLQGDRAGGIKLLLDNMPAAELAFASDGEELLGRYSNLITHLIESGRLDEADHWLAHADGAARRSGLEHSPTGLNLLLAHGGLASRRQDMAGAERFLRQASTLRRELYGPSVTLAVDLLNLGRVVMVLGRPGEAATMLEAAHTMALQRLGPSAVPTVTIELAQVDAFCALKRPDEAEPILAHVDGLSRGDPNSMLRGLYFRGLGFVRVRQHRYPQAKAALDQAEAIFRALGPAGAIQMVDIATLRGIMSKG
jgi:tetratricopeptide (TPR) repeat protein/predicted Ser/Thr protein kinase